MKQYSVTWKFWKSRSRIVINQLEMFLRTSNRKRRVIPGQAEDGDALPMQWSPSYSNLMPILKGKTLWRDPSWKCYYAPLKVYTHHWWASLHSQCRDPKHGPNLGLLFWSNSWWTKCNCTRIWPPDLSAYSEVHQLLPHLILGEELLCVKFASTI